MCDTTTCSVQGGELRLVEYTQHPRARSWLYKREVGFRRERLVVTRPDDSPATSQQCAKRSLRRFDAIMKGWKLYHAPPSSLARCTYVWMNFSRIRIPQAAVVARYLETAELCSSLVSNKDQTNAHPCWVVFFLPRAHACLRGDQQLLLCLVVDFPRHAVMGQPTLLVVVGRPLRRVNLPHVLHDRVVLLPCH